MDALHELAARVGLAATGRFGFAPAGGYAVQAHGFLERPSEDVDLFTVADAEDRFDEAVSAAIEAYRAAGLIVEILRQNPAVARLRLTDGQGGQVRTHAENAPPGMHARYLLNVACAQMTDWRSLDAVTTLRKAEDLAPQLLSHQTIAHTIIAELLPRRRKQRLPGLAALAARVGVTT